jgi:23S rRNA (adenine2503-C2)-methyltransferase
LRHGVLPDLPDWSGLQEEWLIEHRHQTDDQRAVKLRLRSRSRGDVCETVVMRPRPTRGTVCVSTQMGCAVGCAFCATGRMLWGRNLSRTEILEQVLLAKTEVHSWSRRDRSLIHLRNVVFMGMGEPLHNDDAVSEAIRFLIDDRGFGLSPRHITLSTVGVPEKMVAMAQRFPRLRIALSLHAANRPLRRQLVPRATSDLSALRAAIAEINTLDAQEPVWIEYALIADINDQEEHAMDLVAFCQGLRVEINLIPFNDISHSELASGRDSTQEGFAPPRRETTRRFALVLRRAGLFTTIRNTLGDSIRAACGQLIAPSAQKSSQDT